ncbi:MAG: hypothetical protein IJN88_08950 [Clostridia bacterium]|nr:hypothetical protein [Clostridia bacterium]
MICLYTLKDISAFSSDSIYKICLALDSFGLSEESIEDFESYGEMFDAVMSSLERGKHVIVAAEHTDFIKTKKELISKLILESSLSPEMADFITLNAGDDLSEIDMDGHCLAPEGSVLHITSDGLYSGFTCDALSGRLTVIPLDFMRLDEILASIIKNEQELLAIMNMRSENPFTDFAGENIQMPDYDIVPSVEKLVSSLQRLQKKVALTTGEASMWIYNLYDKIDGLTDTIGFVEISDPAEGADSEDEQEADFEESLQNSDEESGIPKESESMRVIRHAREAMYNTECDFGASISPVYSQENENGQTSYYAYVAVVDRSTAKAKKINTVNPDDIPLILPHAVSILSAVVCEKAEVINTAIAKIDYSDEEEEEKEESAAPAAKDGVFTLTKGMLIFAAVVLVFAIVSPVIMTYFMLKPQTTTTTPPDILVNNPAYYQSTTAPTTTQNPFLNTTKNPAELNNGVTEQVAPEVSATSTTAPAPSEKGVFTFYVFGYGHGVGMSQVGANYLAAQGWDAWQILAHYYYDAGENTRIVSGDAYPAKIKYAGTEYNTRDFIASALESEMGGSFQVEALKAQAVAIYTFAKYNGYNLGSDATAFGKTPSQTVYSVVDDVMAGGYYIANGSDVAVTPFHAMSAGVTTSYYNVWGKGIGASVPYLSGGRKSYGDYLDPNFKSTYTITSDDLKKLVKENAKIDLSGDPSTWLGIITHDSAVRDDIGYVSSINVGGTIMTGNDFRIKVMGGRIRSHCFAFTYTPG